MWMGSQACCCGVPRCLRPSPSPWNKDYKDGRFSQFVSKDVDMKLRDDLERLKKISDALDFIRAAEDKGFMANQGAWCSQATNGGCSTSATQTTIEFQVCEI